MTGSMSRTRRVDDDDDREEENQEEEDEEGEEQDEYEEGEDYDEVDNEYMSDDDEPVRQDGRNAHVDDDADSYTDPANEEECSDEKTLAAMREEGDNEICCRICYEVRPSL